MTHLGAKTKPYGLALEIAEGRRLCPDKDRELTAALIESDIQELGAGADLLRSHFSGDYVNLCTIVSGKKGRCSEDCRYCAQSSHFPTGCETQDMLSPEAILREAYCNYTEGVDRFSIVTSGRSLTGKDFEKALEAYALIHEALPIKLCASMGFLSPEQFRRLKAAGVTRYHDNIETSRRYFPFICTTHTFDDKLNAIRAALSEGLSVCSGGIIGMGETWEDRLDMAFTLRELGVSSIPLNVLMPIPGTPLADMPPLSREDILRTIALFRYIHPTAHIRMAGGRNTLPEHGACAFQWGASAAITGNMLTTCGSTIAGDRQMLAEMGRKVLPICPGSSSPCL